MPLLGFVRFFTTLLSLAILAAAGYLLWSWYEGHLVRTVAGDLVRERDGWRLWTSLGLLAWSFLGSRLIPLLIAKRDTRRTIAQRGGGQMIASPTGSSLYVETHGPMGAPMIIFTHGWGMDSTFWHYAKEDLGDRFRLLLWDLPGLGRSKAADREAIGLNAFATDLAHLVNFAGRPAVLVGHSIGGMTIQTLVREFPLLHSRLAGIVLLNTTYTDPLKTMIFSSLFQALRRPVLEPMMKLVIALQPVFWALKWQSYLSGSSHMANRLGFGRFATRSQLEHTSLLSTRNPPGILARGNLAMMHWDATDVLTRLRVPALVIGGDLDIITKLEASRELAGESDLATLQVVAGVNHMGPMERADLYNRATAEFVLQVQPSATEDVAARAGDDETVGIQRDGDDRPIDRSIH